MASSKHHCIYISYLKITGNPHSPMQYILLYLHFHPSSIWRNWAFSAWNILLLAVSRLLFLRFPNSLTSPISFLFCLAVIHFISFGLSPESFSFLLFSFLFEWSHQFSALKISIWLKTLEFIPATQVYLTGQPGLLSHPKSDVQDRTSHFSYTNQSILLLSYLSK